MRRFAPSSCCFGFVGVFFASSVRAAPPERLIWVGGASCPSASALGAELAPLLPHTELIVEGEPARGAAVSEARSAEARLLVEDEGESFSVSLPGDVRRFDDAGRDCAERARAAAVFVALRLDPPELEAASPSVEDPAAPESQPPEVDPLRVRSQLELGPFLLVAPAAEITAPAPLGGLALRYFYGARVGLSVGLAASLPGTLHYPSLDVRALWFPLDVGARVQLLQGEHELSLDVGVALTFFVVRGEELPEAEEHLRVELGGRLGLIYHYWFTPRWGILAGAQALAFPRPYRFVVEPGSLVGSTPSAWFGGSFGVAFRFD